jgi:hypothetical protein
VFAPVRIEAEPPSPPARAAPTAHLAPRAVRSRSLSPRIVR